MKDKISEEALKRLKIIGAQEGKSGRLPDEELQAIRKSVENALRASNPFLMQMLLMGLVFSQALAPHVERHIREQSKGSQPNRINLTEIAGDYSEEKGKK